MTEPVVTFTKVYQDKQEHFVLETGDMPRVAIPSIRGSIAVTMVRLVFLDDVYQTCTMTGRFITPSGGFGAMREAPFPSNQPLPEWLAPYSDIATIRGMDLVPNAMRAADSFE